MSGMESLAPDDGHTPSCGGNQTTFGLTFRVPFSHEVRRGCTHASAIFGHRSTTTVFGVRIRRSQCMFSSRMNTDAHFTCTLMLIVMNAAAQKGGKPKVAYSHQVPRAVHVHTPSGVTSHLWVFREM